MEAVITDYFTSLFTSHTGTRTDELLQHVFHRVTLEMNDSLMKEFTATEVKAALDCIGDLKAPGLDGLPAVFYKTYWQLIGDRVTREVLHVLNGNATPEGWNETCVVLIPKVKNPERMKDLRPISLCNVIYILVSKVLANRLKHILHEIVAPNQSAFVPGRLITDNILLAYEVTHFMQNKRSGATGYAALKLDMSKAYDRVEWYFLEAMMRKMGFAERWIDLIMNCCSTVKYRFRINGSLTDDIVPQRGLRHGDPISPYLFLLCAEAFSCLMNSAEQDGRLEGVKICQIAPSFNHLLFADDSLILLKVSEDNSTHLQNVLSLYEDCSGQTVNVDKTSIMFSKNTNIHEKKGMMSKLGLSRESWNERYLGLPVYLGQSRIKVFSYLKDRVWHKIQGWKEKMLSKAGKEILIKACAQAIPTFAMSVFDITKGLCEQISPMVGRYFWAHQDKENKIHWLSWERLTMSKKEGGLGYKDLHTFNLAMLAKKGWRMLNCSDSLCARVLKAKYFQTMDILSAEPKEGMSYTWRSILKGLEVLKAGVIKCVGDGSTIDIWLDPWLSRNWSRTPTTPRRNIIVQKVEELMDPFQGGWDEALVKDIFGHQDSELILAIPIRPDMDDTWAWFPDHRGIFSVRSAYKLCRKVESVVSGEQGTCDGQLFKWQTIWDAPCPLKIQQFLWRTAHNSLPVRRNLVKKGMKVDTICPVCHRFDEDGAHMLLKCKLVKKLWRELQLEEQRATWANFDDPRQLVESILQLQGPKLLMAISLCWNWWCTRNKINAEKKSFTHDQVLLQIRRSALEFQDFSARKRRSSQS
uniref:Reverse transcriptase domain-containing protein n=1 Tax=Hordeum vulgare subsp. vulgare TaxID=112509 RepID=A0A8I7B954_HORVV